MCLCDNECMSAYFLTSALKEAVGVLLYLHALPFLNLWIPPWLHFCWKEQEGYHHLACVNSRSAVELWPCNSYWHTFHWPLMSPGSASACLMCPVWQRVNVCVCVCVCVDIMSRRWRISFAGRRVYGLNASVYLLIDWQKLTENWHTNIIVKNYNKMITNIKYISKNKKTL